MAAAAVCLRSGRQCRLPLPRFNLGRSDWIQRLTNPRTLSVGIVVKETLPFLNMEPAVPWRIPVNTFSRFENVFSNLQIQIEVLINYSFATTFNCS